MRTWSELKDFRCVLMRMWSYCKGKDSRNFCFSLILFLCWQLLVRFWPCTVRTDLTKYFLSRQTSYLFQKKQKVLYLCSGFNNIVQYLVGSGSDYRHLETSDPAQKDPDPQRPMAVTTTTVFVCMAFEIKSCSKRVALGSVMSPANGKPQNHWPIGSL